MKATLGEVYNLESVKDEALKLQDEVNMLLDRYRKTMPMMLLFEMVTGLVARYAIYHSPNEEELNKSFNHMQHGIAYVIEHSDHLENRGR